MRYCADYRFLFLPRMLEPYRDNPEPPLTDPAHLTTIPTTTGTEPPQPRKRPGIVNNATKRETRFSRQPQL